MGTTRKTISIFLRESKRYPWHLTGMLVCWPIGIALQEMILPLIAAQTINKLVQNAQHGTNNWADFTPFLVAFLVVGVIGQAFIFGGLSLIVRLQTKVRQNLENKTFNWLLQQSLDFHNNSFSGALVNQANRFSSGFVAITDILLNQALETLVKFIVAIIVLLFLSPVIALALFTWTIFFVWLNITLTRKRIKLSRIAAKADTALTAQLADSIANVATIKSFARESNEGAAYFEKSNDRAVKKFRAWRRAIRNGSITALMMTGLQFAILVLSIYAVMQQHVQVGTLLLVQVYILQLIASLWGLGSITRGLEQNFSDAEEMTEILHRQPEVQDPTNPQPFTVPRGEITMDHFDFSHSDAKDDPLFTDFTLHIKPGEKVGLVGQSGSGKTTLTKLLLRFADIDKGAILIDGQDISKIRQSDLRSHIAYVPQEPLLFHRTIRENIAYGNPNATDAQIAAAAKRAHAAEFIDHLPKGYDTMVGERGVKLSGGQRQRIAIARAILKDAPILLLDEATSALDSESERLIQDALKELIKGRTTIVIAHRLSTIQHMDRIVVLANGVIKEQGSHTELLQHDGIYAQLWAHQSGGFIEE
ncbi:MAG TPA: ABC transporter ATP-binding protein [Candidatus Saccharimonas sp.]|nr:ABC transporter ATP-binding protein [Candidatus Saccharimonas sp.]